MTSLRYVSYALALQEFCVPTCLSSFFSPPAACALWRQGRASLQIVKGVNTVYSTILRNNLRQGVSCTIVIPVFKKNCVFFFMFWARCTRIKTVFLLSQFHKSALQTFFSNLFFNSIILGKYQGAFEQIIFPRFPLFSVFFFIKVSFLVSTWRGNFHFVSPN